MPMRVAVKIYRTAKVQTAHLKQSVGLEVDAPNDKAAEALKKSFGPHLAPGIKIFWAEGFKTTIVGMEALGFDVPVPTTGAPQGTDTLIMCDPIDDRDTHRIDGALRGELMRMGLWTEADDYEWRVATSIKP